jgi:hypothetical protein
LGFKYAILRPREGDCSEGLLGSLKQYRFPVEATLA